MPDPVRALAIAGLALAAAAALLALPRRRLVAGVLLAWWCVPPIAVAYAWSWRVWPPGQADLLHALLAALRLAPIAAALVLAAPAPPLDRAGAHLLRLTGRPWHERLRLALWQGPGRPWLWALLLVLPLAWGEFELASRLALPTWAVRLFDAQAGGLDARATLATALPALAALALALAAAWPLSRGGRPAAPPPASAALAPLGWLVLGLGSAALVLLPLGLIAAEAGPGLGAALAGFALGRECAASLLFAAAASALAWLAAGLLPGRWALAAALPGLLGTLPLALAALTWLPCSTPLPVVLVLALAALPWAVLLRRSVLAAEAAAAAHLAGLLAAGDAAQRRAGAALAWRLGGGVRWAAIGALFCACAGDLAAGAMLAPVEMPTVLPRLYHFMHYGRSAQLAALVLAATLLPLLAAAAVWGVRAALVRGGAPSGRPG